MVPTMVRLPGQSRSMVQLLPPPSDRHNPLTAVDLARCAEVSFCVAAVKLLADLAAHAGLFELGSLGGAALLCLPEMCSPVFCSVLYCGDTTSLYAGASCLSCQ